MEDYKRVIGGKVMWMDARGAFVPEENVRVIDQLRDEVVRELVQVAISTNAYLAQVKKDVTSKIEDFLDLSSSEYGVARGGAKGNVELKTFDGSQKVSVAITEYLEPDEQLQAAKKLIDECLESWSHGANSNLVTVVQDAFRVNKKGAVDVKRLVELQRYDISEPKWQTAMEALRNSLHVGRTTRYIRFYIKDPTRRDGALMPILLDWAAI